MFQEFRRNIQLRIGQAKLKKGVIPSPEQCFELMRSFEQDETKEPEFRCIASVCVREPLLWMFCFELDIAESQILSIAFVILMNLPTTGINERDRSNFARFREVVRDRALPVWTLINIKS